MELLAFDRSRGQYWQSLSCLDRLSRWNDSYFQASSTPRCLFLAPNHSTRLLQEGLSFCILDQLLHHFSCLPRTRYISLGVKSLRNNLDYSPTVWISLGWCMEFPTISRKLWSGARNLLSYTTTYQEGFLHHCHWLCRPLCMILSVRLVPPTSWRQILWLGKTLLWSLLRHILCFLATPKFNFGFAGSMLHIPLDTYLL